MANSKRYFYAFQDSSLYDSSIEAVVPFYSLMIRTVTGFVRSLFSSEKALQIMDIGAGTGNDSIPIMDKFPFSKLIAYDLSESMKKVFLFNASKNGIEKERVEFRVQDFLTDQTNDCVDLVISAYCIHHYDISVKTTFFERIYESLIDGGWFVLSDLANFQSKHISTYAHEFDLEYIRSQFDDLQGRFVKDVPLEDREHLKKSWIQHMKEENILDTAEIQMDILRQIGFREVECIYKFQQHVIIVAKK